jgi:hypothetical protein
MSQEDYDKNKEKDLLDVCIKINTRDGRPEHKTRRGFFEFMLDTYLGNLSERERYIIATLVDIAFPEFKLPDNHYLTNPKST